MSFMQSIVVVLGKYGIRCNVLLLGIICMQFNEEDLKNDEKRMYMEGRIFLGRIGDLSDMVGLVVFFVCDELSGYVIGVQLFVDGGLFVNF